MIIPVQSSDGVKSSFAKLKSGVTGSGGALSADEVKEVVESAERSPERINDSAVDEARGYLETSKAKSVFRMASKCIIFQEELLKV